MARDYDHDLVPGFDPGTRDPSADDGTFSPPDGVGSGRRSRRGGRS